MRRPAASEAVKTMIEMQPHVREVAYYVIRTPRRLKSRLAQKIKQKRICVLASLMLAGLAFVLAPSKGFAQQDNGALLVLESKITLGSVNGRIDHLAFDVARKQVFIAELENNTVGVVDLGGARLLHRISGLNAPQGVGYVPSADALFVANGGDGTVRGFKSGELKPVAEFMVGGHPHNVRVGPDT